MKDKKIREANLLHGRRNLVGIYQLKKDKSEYHFMNTDYLRKHNMAVRRENYELIYIASLRVFDNPEKIFRRFNLERPKDFKGHSLSVGDVIVMNNGRKVDALFVDSVGFTDVPQFLTEIKHTNDIRIVEQIDHLIDGDTVYLYDGEYLFVEQDQKVDWQNWDQVLYGKDSAGKQFSFHISEAEKVVSRDEVEFLRYHERFIHHFYVVDDLNAAPLAVTSYERLDDAVEAYRNLPESNWKALGIEKMEIGAIDFLQCISGEDTLISDFKKSSDWMNSEVYAIVQELKESFQLEEEQSMEENMQMM